MKKSYKIIMLQTDKVDGAILEFKGKIGQAGDYNPIHKTGGAEYQHLYILCDDEITGNMISSGEAVYDRERDAFYKVLASTDKSLTPEALIPDSFVSDYVKSYNEGKTVREVILEMDEEEYRKYTGDAEKFYRYTLVTKEDWTVTILTEVV